MCWQLRAHWRIHPDDLGQAGQGGPWRRQYSSRRLLTAHRPLLIWRGCAEDKAVQAGYAAIREEGAARTNQAAYDGCVKYMPFCPKTTSMNGFHGPKDYVESLTALQED